MPGDNHLSSELPNVMREMQHAQTVLVARLEPIQTNQRRRKYPIPSVWMLRGRTDSLQRKRLQPSHVNVVRLWLSPNRQMNPLMR